MGYKEDAAEQAHREAMAQRIAELAAKLIATGMGRQEAVDKVAEALYNQQEAEGDPTGAQQTLAENQPPIPAREASKPQIEAIKKEILDLAEDAAGRYW